MAWPLVAAAAVAVAVFVPPRVWPEEAGRARASGAERAAAARQIAPAAASGNQGLADPQIREASEEQLRVLEEVERELAAGAMEPRQAGARAASALEEVARRLEQEARTEERATDAVREELVRAAAEARERRAQESAIA